MPTVQQIEIGLASNAPVFQQPVEGAPIVITICTGTQAGIGVTFLLEKLNQAGNAFDTIVIAGTLGTPFCPIEAAGLWYQTITFTSLEPGGYKLTVRGFTDTGEVMESVRTFVVAALAPGPVEPIGPPL